MNSKRKTLRPILVAILIVTQSIVPSTSQARTLLDMFNSMGGYSNTTGAGAVRGEISNYYTGGSLYARTPTVQASVYDIQPPSVKGGCGGVDLYLGGLSYINGTQIMALLKAAAKNLESELFFLALDTFVPVVSAVIKKLQAMSQQALGVTANSCAMATNLLASTGVTGYAQEKKRQVSEWTKTWDGSATDAYDAEQLSKDDAVATAANTQALSNPAMKDQVQQGNFVWRAIYNADFNDPAIADSLVYKEMLMSMVGTAIFPTDNSPPVILAPLTIDLKKIVGNNGESTAMIEIYECEAGSDGYELGCQKPGQIPVQKDIGTSFRQLAVNRLTQIANSMGGTNGTDGSPPSKPDQAYLGTSSIPLYKLMAMASADPGLAQSMVETAAEVLAVDYAYHYIREAYKNLERSITARRGAVDSAQELILKQILDNKTHLMGSLEAERYAAYGKVQQQIQVAETMRTYDRVLARKSSEAISGQ